MFWRANITQGRSQHSKKGGDIGESQVYIGFIAEIKK